jgi:hypothetical protein
LPATLRSDAAGASYGAYGYRSTEPLVPVSTLAHSAAYSVSPVPAVRAAGLSSTYNPGVGASGSPRSMFLTGSTAAYTSRTFASTRGLCGFCGMAFENVSAHEAVCVKNPRKNKSY